MLKRGLKLDRKDLSEEEKMEKIQKYGPNYYKEIDRSAIFRMAMKVNGESW